MSEMLKTRHLTGALPPCALVRALPPGLIGGLIGPVSICFHNKQTLSYVPDCLSVDRCILYRDRCTGPLGTPLV